MGDSGTIEVVKNPALEEHLRRWDRELPDDRRCFGIKLLLAGAEHKGVRDGLYRIGVRKILVSYYYMYTWLRKRAVAEVAEDFGRFDYVFLDSGGFTMLQEVQKGGETSVDVNAYAEMYYKDLEKYGKVFAGCAEVDLPKRLGIEYSEDAKLRLRDLGIPIVPVIQGKPLEYYDGLGWFDNYPYIAVGSAYVESSKHKRYIASLYKLAEDRGILLHGFGATSAEVIVRSKFYSIDSTTWINGSKFGATHLFESGRIRHYDNTQKDTRRRFRKRFVACGLDWVAIEKETCAEVDLMNALAWKQLGEYIAYSAIKSFWLTADERDHALTLKGKAFNAEGIIDRKASLARTQARRLSTVTDADDDDRAHETLYCATCHLTGRCPRYKVGEGEVCGYDINIRIDSQLDVHKMLRIVLEAQYGRAMTGVLFEKMDGGGIDKNVSAELQRLIQMAEQMKRIFEPTPQQHEGDELTLKAKTSTGGLSAMLAQVFTPTGTGGSGSGNTQTQRAANAVVVESEKVPGEG